MEGTAAKGDPPLKAPSAVSDADIIIIGSGFAGAICADRLSRAGARVVVLERGPWRDSLPVRAMGIPDRAPFPYGPKALTHLVRNLRIGPLAMTLNKAGLFELTVFSGLGVLAASAVGGGSHAWAAMLTPPQDRAFWSNRHPGLKAQDVEAHYETVISDLGAERLSQGHWLANSVWTQLPAKAGRRCTPSDTQPYMAIQLPQSEDEAGRMVDGPNGVRRTVCAFDGDSLLGSRGGAKASVDYIHLAPALARGAVVRDLCEVTGISPVQAANGGGYSVRFRNLRDGTNETLRGAQVVCAAGTMNTLRLLHANSAGPGGLSHMPSLGRTFGTNGDLFGLWLNPPSQSSSFAAPPVLGAFVVDGQETPCLALAGLPGVDTLPLPGFLKRMLGRAVIFLGVGADSGRGVVGFRHGRLQVRYDAGQEPVFDQLRDSFRALEADTGRKAWVNNLLLTLHPWGGAGLGADAADGVIDHNGEVYGNPGLFVVDGAALPAAPGTPPTLSISAWAHHVAERLAQRI